MPRIGRYNLSEISLRRVLSAVNMRLQEFPHALAWAFSSRARMNRQKLAGFQNIHLGERCFIVANGPSLKVTNLELLQNEFTFGLNRIYLHFDQVSFRPSYYVTVNELILEQFSGDIAVLNMPKFLNWNRRAHFDLPAGDVNFLKSRLVINDSFQTDITKPLVVGATVTFVALQLAYYMGFRDVFLVGLDHTYVEKGLPSGTETRTAEQDQSHFHPQYFPRGSRWQLPDLLRSEVDFSLARRAFEADGRRIFDATIGGKCEIFEKIDYSSIKFK
jgi:hypothetical protein